MDNTAAEIINIMREKKLTLGTVESATGGLIAHMITNIPGSSDVFRGSIISYSNEIKIKIVGVKEATLQESGAVSGQVARAMAKRGRKVLGVDICVADTGIAGPGGATPENRWDYSILGCRIKKAHSRRSTSLKAPAKRTNSKRHKRR